MFTKGDRVTLSAKAFSLGIGRKTLGREGTVTSVAAGGSVYVHWDGCKGKQGFHPSLLVLVDPEAVEALNANPI